jgi:hypothetical protein
LWENTSETNKRDLSLSKKCCRNLQAAGPLLLLFFFTHQTQRNRKKLLSHTHCLTLPKGPNVPFVFCHKASSRRSFHPSRETRVWTAKCQQLKKIGAHQWKTCEIQVTCTTNLHLDLNFIKFSTQISSWRLLQHPEGQSQATNNNQVQAPLDLSSVRYVRLNCSNYTFNIFLKKEKNRSINWKFRTY